MVCRIAFCVKRSRVFCKSCEVLFAGGSPFSSSKSIKQVVFHSENGLFCLVFGGITVSFCKEFGICCLGERNFGKRNLLLYREIANEQEMVFY